MQKIGRKKEQIRWNFPFIGFYLHFHKIMSMIIALERFNGISTVFETSNKT